MDLVFVEFSFNDGEMSSWSQYVDDPRGTRKAFTESPTAHDLECVLKFRCHRRGIERIFRKVLNMPNRPAVVYYHFHPAMFGMFKTHYTVGIEDRIEVSPLLL